MKIISGGQIGADIAGLRAAKKLGFETGGWMPKGFKTLEGPHPEYAELYDIKEGTLYSYPERTRLNVMMSDCTIRFAYNWNSPGERLTVKECERQKKPWLNINIFSAAGPKAINAEYLEQFAKFASNKNIINIAGNADSEIEDIVENFIWMAFQ